MAEAGLLPGFDGVDTGDKAAPSNCRNQPDHNPDRERDKHNRNDDTDGISTITSTASASDAVTNKETSGKYEQIKYATVYSSLTII